MKKIIVSIALLFAVLTLAFAADVYFSGDTSLYSVLSLPPVNDPWEFTDVSLSQDFELDVYADSSAFFFSAGVEYDALESTLDSYLSEVYGDYFLNSFAFRLGRQKASWGTAEILSAVDVLTPSDLSDPIDFFKMAVDALKISYDAFPLVFDAYWIPFFTASVLPQSVLDVYSFYNISISEPENKIENSEGAAKVSAYTSAGDFSLYGYYGWEDTPNSTGKYDRLIMGGASAAVPVGEVTVKGEAAWYPKRDAVVSATAGVEWIKNDLTLTGELYGQWNKEDENITGQAGLAASYSLFDGDMELSAGGILEFKELDGAVTAELSYSFTDELKATASVFYMFEGSEGTGTYGAYKDLDSARIEVSYSF
ncbi:MAG: OprO/OprP family phosphate-selective porin [Sphaerochaetaceae bacterium]|nr:OprO/OprP family phosphate-selective porin [Sphaerochaetaceae bacterium]